MRLQTNLHYQAAFDVCPAEQAEAWKILVKTVRAWMRERSGFGDQIGGSWFYTYGKVEHPSIRGQSVETNREIGSGTSEQPEFWSARMQIQDRSAPERFWRTDVGVTARGEGRYTVAITVMNFLRPGYMGAEPPAPSFSAPQITERLLADYWRPHSGDLPLTNGPLWFRADEVPYIINLLQSRQRRCPIVWVSRERTYRDPIVAPHGLTSKIAGAAAILVSCDGDAEAALIDALPYKFRAVDGMVRIYQPGARLEDEWDAGRHRYYSRAQIEELGASQVAVEIIRALTRRMDLGRHDGVFSIEDVRDRHRRGRLSQLRENRSETGDHELIQLLEEDNARLEQLVDDLESEVNELELRVLEAEEKAEENRRQCEQAVSFRVDAEKALAAANRSRDAIDTFRKLPTSVLECASIVQALHGQRIVFTENALDSAKDASFNDVREDLQDVWGLLWGIATDLHELVFDKNLERRALEQEFKARTGFDFSFTESDTTRRDSRLMAKREFTFEGKNFLMEPHAKLDRSDRNRYLRVHIACDHDRRLIIVNHCGDHLDNAATRKRS